MVTRAMNYFLVSEIYNYEWHDDWLGVSFLFKIHALYGFKMSNVFSLTWLYKEISSDFQRMKTSSCVMYV